MRFAPDLQNSHAPIHPERGRGRSGQSTRSRRSDRVCWSSFSRHAGSSSGKRLTSSIVTGEALAWVGSRRTPLRAPPADASRFSPCRAKLESTSPMVRRSRLASVFAAIKTSSSIERVVRLIDSQHRASNSSHHTSTDVVELVSISLICYDFNS